MSRYGIIELHDLYNFKAPNAYKELVRCKECKHWHKWSDGEMFCGCLDGGIGTDADDYCSFGEREGE